jgi:uncharacterized protein
MDELEEVLERPLLRNRIDPFDKRELVDLIHWYRETVKLTTVPPHCRDPKDHPVLSTAMDGNADAIVTGDDDLRADEELREAMAGHGIQIWGVRSLLTALDDD